MWNLEKLQTIYKTEIGSDVVNKLIFTSGDIGGWGRDKLGVWFIHTLLCETDKQGPTVYYKIHTIL